MIFKSIDRKIADLGFKEIKNDKYGIEYERNDGLYIHKVVLLHKVNVPNILQSYDPQRCGSNAIGCINVGLTYEELVLFAKKMKQAGLK